MILEGRNKGLIRASLMGRFDCVQNLSRAHDMDKLQHLKMSVVWTLALD